MALSGSSIVIVLIGVATYAVAVPVQTGPNTLQQNENEGLTDLLARYWEDRRMNQGAKRNLDQIDGGHLVRNIDKQFKDLLNEEENHLIQYLKSVSDKQILDTIRRKGLFADRFHNGNLINSSINSETFANTISYPHSSDLNAGQVNDQLFMDQLIDRDDNMRDRRKKIVKNLALKIGSRHFTRNLDQIGGGNLVRNLDQIGGGNLVRNLDQIGGGHLVRNLDQIGGGHLVRNLDQFDGENIERNVDYQNTEMKQRVDESADILEKQPFIRNLDQIGGGNLVRNLDQIGGGNLVRNLDQIGGGNLVRNLDQIDGGNRVRSFN